MDVKQTLQRGGPAERQRLREQQRADSGAATREPDPGKLRALAAEAAELPTRLGVDRVADDDGGTAQVIVDPDALAFGRAFRRILKDDPDVPADLQATVGALGQALDQQHRVESIAAAADQLDSDLGDTDRAAAWEEQRLLAGFYELIDGLCDGTLGDLSQPDRDRLRQRASEVLALRAEDAQAAQRERELTLETGREAQATIEAGADRAHLLRTSRDLREDRTVSPEDLDAALRTFAAITEAGAPVAGTPPAPVRRAGKGARGAEPAVPSPARRRTRR